MYEGQTAQSMPQTKQPLLRQAHDDLSDLLISNRDMICSVQERLHKIMDKSSQVDVASNAPLAPKNEDIQQHLTEDICFLRENNRMLDKILSHLSDII